MRVQTDPEVRLLADEDHHLVMRMIRDERRAQMRKWGEQNHPDGTSSGMAGLIADQWKRVCDTKHRNDEDNWATIAAEEFFECMAETDEDKLLEEVVQNAAVFAAWAEDIVRRRRLRKAQGD